MNSCNNNVEIEGGTFRTWTCHSSKMKPLHMSLFTNEGPFDANIELWEDRYDMPYKIRIYSENGKHRPLMTRLLTYEKKNKVTINNIDGHDALFARVFVSKNNSDNISAYNTPEKIVTPMVTLQRQTPCTYTFASSNDVDITLQTDGYPLNGRIEILQNSISNIQQIIEVYTKNGYMYPFLCRIRSNSDTIRIINTAHKHIPIKVSVLSEVNHQTIF